jgi:nucleotide-binding universal stress UspA family protein
MSAPKHIIAATDFSKASDRAVDLAAEVAAALGAKLTLMHAFETPYPYPVALPPNHMRDLRAKLEARCIEIRARVGHVDVVVREGAPWNEIVSLASETGADMIVVGTHGRRGLPHLLLGSVAERVVRLSPVPVMTVPDGGSSDPSQVDS